MNSTWKAILGVLLVFILGWLAGALCSGLYFRHRVLAIVQGGPEAVAQVLEKRMTRNLDLNDTQRQQVHSFILQNLQQRKQLQSQIQPEVQMANRQTLSQINSILTPDQRVVLHANLIEFRQRFGKSPFNPNAEVGNGQPPPIPSPPPPNVPPPPVNAPPPAPATDGKQPVSAPAQ